MSNEKFQRGRIINPPKYPDDCTLKGGEILYMTKEQEENLYSCFKNTRNEDDLRFFIGFRNVLVIYAIIGLAIYLIKEVL